jgi:YD repeat-containing protein
VQTGPGSLAAGSCASGDTPFARWTTRTVFAVLCTDGQTALLRRVDASGAPLGDVDLSGAVDPGSSYIAAGTIVQAPGTGTLYVWDAFGRRISAVDTVAGRVDRTTIVEGIGASAGGPPSVLGMLGAIGRVVGHLVVPSVVAKVYLDPALAIAPDGSRLYLLATAATGFTDAGRGSLGIVVLDRDLGVVERWAPTADLVSVAVSVDGAWVLAAGSPGVDASGAEAQWEASITAYDAASGGARAVAGGLGPEVVTLVPAAPR